MSKRKGRKLHTRVFLNDRNGMAALEARVYTSPPYHEQEGSYCHGCSASLSLSDCGQTISIDFESSHEEKYIKERLNKLDKIRKALDLIEEGLIEAYFHGATKEEIKAVHASRKGDGYERPIYLED